MQDNAGQSRPHRARMRATGTEPVVLQSGDQLTREGFPLRSSLRADRCRTELVLRIVHLSALTRIDVHGDPVGVVGGLKAAPLVVCCRNAGLD